MLILGEVIEKLKDVISETTRGKKVFDKDVATALNIPQATFATMKKRNSIPYEEILEFCALKKISVNWLFFDQAIDMLKEETEKFFHVRYFSDIRASAGGGAEVFDENYETISIDEKIMRNMVGLGNTELEAIHVDGESMEPTLQDGSIVFVDRTQTNIAKNGIFIAATTGGLFIKRIQQRADGMIELISDNTMYPPQAVAADEVIIVGKVVGNIESL
ncbi:MAG TPA: LexA family transcriptional regulator [Sulfurovum sp.]|jgi:phage repressor protein C with HTH and peptisase S24 domain|nr:MAG: phage repressor protein [Sulfurovum sp. 35-42-20]OYZ26445.1 MAG: phage repressor protein [Sulfurovum sp. 16-42-52]OYZ48547.1 MAG: phage repressor protein [Sulfurovum sp. 24-42-9]OZA46353.1 MAG: phage repressor protein [Sulfurovum sp. 17-42-90]OZA60446.1 MAG: phage repressor protein [Sulfurovum sp. 39-42-12]HQR73217.1 LexA family transcriptional regulator [Sulfurovum sp.]